MTTSKGTIQGYNGVASADMKHQIIIDAQAFGAGQEHHVLQPVLEKIKSRYKETGMSNNLYKEGVIVTADTGYANEDNMKYLHDSGVNAYIPDNQFRSRDPKLIKQKDKYGKRKHNTKTATNAVIPASEFTFNASQKQCVCPAGNLMWLKNNRKDIHGNDKLFFEGRLSDCRNCTVKQLCMKNPDAADSRKGHGRQA